MTVKGNFYELTKYPKTNSVVISQFIKTNKHNKKQIDLDVVTSTS